VLWAPLEPHACAVREPGSDVAAGEAGLALRHLFLRLRNVSHTTRGAPRAAAPRDDSSICSKLSTNSGSFCVLDNRAARRNRSLCISVAELLETIASLCATFSVPERTVNH